MSEKKTLPSDRMKRVGMLYTMSSLEFTDDPEATDAGHGHPPTLTLSMAVAQATLVGNLGAIGRRGGQPAGRVNDGRG
jgi:hypothetical protein